MPRVVTGVVSSLALAACGTVIGPAVGPASGSTTPGSVAAATLSRMTQAQRVGQLFMVGIPATGASATTLATLRNHHVGNVILTGRTYAGVAAVARVTAKARAQATRWSTARVPPFVGTDQEGGYVQVLRGRGFSAIPTALTQGTWSTTHLRHAARAWGRQLHAAGVNVNLAPVTDTVPGATFARRNLPIGRWEREFGFSTTRVANHSVAFTRGMAAAHVDATAKHFPGLGRVTANPDSTAGVRDRTTTRHDAYVAPFGAAVKANVPFVMVSTAYYTRIDAAHPAAFSRTVVGGMLRGDLHFNGVVVSDDLGNARQVAAWSPGLRATHFVGAGGDMILTVSTRVLPAMYTAVLNATKANPAFRAKVNRAALRILTAKARLGLIH